MSPEADGPSTLRRLLSQLRKRKLVQWAIAYGAGAWLLLQVVDVIGPRWGLTDALSRTVDVVLVVGFATTLVLAWYHGEQGRQRVNGMELLILGALLFLGGIGMRLVGGAQDAAQVALSDEPPVAENLARERPAGPEASLTTQDAPGQLLRTIAVLPFDNFSPNEDDAYFAAGITEEITGQLARIGDLTVLSRTAVERAVAGGASLDDIASALGAGSVLEGSVRMAGSRVRIAAQLIEVESQRHLWAENFDRELNDIFQIQTDVALAIGDALLAQLSRGERERIETPLTEDIRAYQLYLRQQKLIANDPEENPQAIALLEQALKLDPAFPEALARLSWRHTWQARMTGDRAEAERAEQLALEALAQDPELAGGYHALSAAFGMLERIKEEGAALARAFELDPNAKPVLLDGSYYHATVGNPAAGLEMAFQAVRLDPNNPNDRWHAYMPLLFLGDEQRMAAWLQLARDEGMRYHRLDVAQAELELVRGNPQRAAELARDMLERYPDTQEARRMALGVLFLTGNMAGVSEELLAVGRKAPEAWAMPQLAPRSMRVLTGYLMAEQGDEAAARQAFDEGLEAMELAVARGSSHQGRALDAASIHAFRGEHEAALRELERAYALGLRADFALAIDPFFRPLREHPQFQALLKRMADSQQKQRAIALRNGYLEGYDALIAAGLGDESG